MTAQYRQGRNIWTIFASESLMDSKIVGPYLEVIHLARTMGYNLFISKERILTEVQEVASSKRFARSVTLKAEINNVWRKNKYVKIINTLTHWRRLTQKCVIAHPCVVDGPRISAFSYTLSNTRVFELLWHTDRFKVIVSYMQHICISSYKQTDRSWTLF